MGKVILEKILLRNWHAFVDNQFDVSDLSTLITGMNASGKTTLLDAISIILDGANANDFNVAVKDEGERRTISGALHYVVSGVPKRTGRVTGLILTQFYDQTYNARFLNGVFLRSKSYSSDASITQQYFSVINVSIDDPSFTIDFDKCKIPKQIDYPNKKVAFEEFFRFRKMQQVKQDTYKGLINSVLRAKLDCPPSDFVRKNILPEDDKVSTVEAIKNNYKLLDDREKLYEELSQEVECLNQVKNTWYDLKESEHNYSMLAFSKKKFIVSRLDEIKTQKNNLALKIQDARNNKKKLEEKLSELSVKSGEYKSSDIITTKRRELAVLNRELISLKTEANRFKVGISTLNEVSKLIGEKLKFSKGSETSEIDDLLIKAEQHISEIEDKEAEGRDKLSFLRKELNEAKADMTAIKMGVFTAGSSFGISSRITAAKELTKVINKYFEDYGIDDRAHLLYEALESVTEESWQPAIEALIGYKRANIIVKPENESIATKLQNKTELKADVDIILSSKLRALPEKKNSVASKIVVKSETAKHIIQSYYGQYVLCETMDKYNKEDYAITKTGMSKTKVSSHKSSKALEKEILLIGSSAKKGSLKEIELRISTLSAKEEKETKDLKDIGAKKRNLNLLLSSLKTGIVLNPEIVDEYEAKIKAIEKSKEEIDALTKSSGTKMIEGIQRDLNDVRKELRNHDTSFELSFAQETKLNSELSELEKMLPEVEKQISLILNPEIIDETQIEEYYSSMTEKSIDEISKKQSSLLVKGKSLSGKLKGLQTEYNLKFHKDFKMGTDETTYSLYAKRLIHLEGKACDEITGEIKKLKDSLKESKEGVFKGISESFTFAKNEVEKINAILSAYEISGNKFKIQIDPTLRKMELYNAIINFATEESPDKKVIELLNETFDRMINSKDLNTFLDFADYRNYLDCDVLISNEETRTWKSFSAEKGSFSGGQKETPYYMCLAAALSCKAYTNNGIRLIVLDEAFKNMDQVNKVKALSMFRNLNLQVILFTSNSDLADCTEHIYVITKYNNRIVTAFGKNGTALKVIDKRTKVKERL